MTLTEVRQLLTTLDLRPSKVLGQNFLVDNNILHILIDEADIRDDETILEIGPGLGALTGALALKAQHLVAIEKDPRLYAYLKEQFPDLELVLGDAVKVLRAGLPAHAARFKVVSNLPYSISTPILELLVEGEPKPSRLVITVQREVAQRLAATPRHKDYGALTLFTQLHYHVTIRHIVSPRCFYPAPQVDSAIVVLDRRDPRVKLLPGAPFHEIVRQGFNQRRKMLRKLLGNFTGVLEAFQAAGVGTTARAEELSLEQWITLANNLSAPPARDEV
jgi:16S rRNA (adenine1518-N6/adenine1519-N6)-dimethyltransferase